jgi:hypothetical protein
MVLDDDEGDIFEEGEKRMRDTYLLGKVFVQNTEYKSNFPPLYLNYFDLNVISDDEDVHDNDLEQDNFYPRST